MLDRDDLISETSAGYPFLFEPVMSKKSAESQLLVAGHGLRDDPNGSFSRLQWLNGGSRLGEMGKSLRSSHSVATQTKSSLPAAIVNRSEPCQCLLASSVIALTEFAGFV